MARSDTPLIPYLIYAHLVSVLGIGIRISVNISSGFIAVLPGPVKNSSKGTILTPLGPIILTLAESVIRGAAVSAAGEALHILPPMVAMLAMVMLANFLPTFAIIRHFSASSEDLAIARMVVVAPILSSSPHSI
ncbi:hypothetical protein ES707_22878 [subsurface metagenome]